MKDAPAASATYAICSVGDILNRHCKGFHLVQVEEDGSEKPFQILIVRWDRKLYGYVNRCPHQGVNLDWERDQFLDSTARASSAASMAPCLRWIQVNVSKAHASETDWSRCVSLCWTVTSA